MGKCPEDLNLNPDEGPSSSAPTEDVRGFLAWLEEMQGSPEYNWAMDTVNGIYETVERTQRVTDGQRRAIGNIRSARQGRPERGQGRRRYEGWSR